jgi:hypothetical protein
MLPWLLHVFSKKTYTQDNAGEKILLPVNFFFSVCKKKITNLNYFFWREGDGQVRVFICRCIHLYTSQYKHNGRYVGGSMACAQASDRHYVEGF